MEQDEKNAFMIVLCRAHCDFGSIGDEVTLWPVHGWMDGFLLTCLFLLLYVALCFLALYVISLMFLALCHGN